MCVHAPESPSNLIGSCYSLIGSCLIPKLTLTRNCTDSMFLQGLETGITHINYGHVFACGQHDYQVTSSPGSSRFPIWRRYFPSPDAAILENEKTLGRGQIIK